MRIVVSALALCISSCALMPPGLRQPSSEEDRAIASARDAWAAASRPPAGCRVLERARISYLPSEQLRLECRALRPVYGCAFRIQPTPFEDRILAILVDAQLDENERASVTIHEALHTLRNCAVAESGAAWLEVLQHGETPDCQIRYGPDPGHCDMALWSVIERDALDRWMRGRP